MKCCIFGFQNLTRMKTANLFLIIVLLYSCGTGESEIEQETEKSEYSMSFTQMSSDATGIKFSNNITETDSFNFFNYEYIYNGGGLAVGDVNNDGLEDLYFTGNHVSDKLYLNKGDLQFEDVTDRSIGPLASQGWHTGAIMQDVNGDGWLDIYVSRSGPKERQDLLSNLYFENNGDGTFTEKGKEYGLDVRSTTTQSLFFDKDNDGDLDLYILNHPYNTKNSKEPKKSVQEVNSMISNGSPFTDILLENNDGHYSDVTKESGINNHAFGLGIAASDIDNDGDADLYISNDYMAPDYLYINNGQGVFEDKSKEQLNHMSNYSMGNEIADYNNDGLLDILSVDMVSENHIRSKKNMGGMSTKRFWEVVSVGYHYQYMFNCLQMNNGNGTFSEVAQLAGISKTDWSWAPLFADFNNDGFKDLYITNGYRRDSRDNDFVNGYNPNNKKVESFQDALDLMPETKIENYMFMNNGDLTFSKMNVEWNTDQLVNSNGAVYSDLDNDGDLDLVVNNIDEESFILKNELNGNNYVKFSFNEPMSEGVKLSVKTDSNFQVNEFRTVRGYQSSVSQILHFGLGSNSTIQEVKIEWPNGKVQQMSDVKANQLLNISKEDAIKGKPTDNNQQGFLNEFELLDLKHKEKFVNDFEREVLLPHKMSQLGPFLSKGDINNDGHEDFYISGSAGESGHMFLGSPSGFKESPGPWSDQRKREELGSEMFDADNDGDLDLYVVSGSNEQKFDSPLMKDQLYINDGNGKFKNGSDSLPEMITSGQKVISGDYDNDGDMDLFVPGRQTPGFYPFAPRSYLLNNQNGRFVDVTDQTGTLMGPGMITDAEFIDLDSDNDLDIVLVGEWMSPSFYRNDGGTFVDISTNYGTQNQIGWWTSVTVADLNNDNKMDFVFGNVGLNNKFHPSKDHPLEIYTADFDQSGSYDIVLGEYENGTCYPVRGKQCSSEQMPFVSQKFPTYGEFATADLEKIYGQEKLNEALHFSATEFRSMVLLSQGNGYSFEPLSNYAQMGPLNAVLVEDVNNDGHVDIIACGNNFAAEVETVRYDGGRGVCLLGDGKGKFSNATPINSGFFVNLDAKDMIKVNGNYIVSSNNSQLLFFKQN